MRRWKSSGRYGLNRGLKKRLWSFYSSLQESTGGDGRISFLEGGISPNEINPTSGTPIMAEDSQIIIGEDGSDIEADLAA